MKVPRRKTNVSPPEPDGTPQRAETDRATLLGILAARLGGTEAAEKALEAVGADRAALIGILTERLGSTQAAEQALDAAVHEGQEQDPEEKYKTAYDAAILALTQQDGTVGNLRNRATGLLTVAALIASFSSALGIINKDNPIPIGFAVALLVILLAIGVCSLWVLWPRAGWSFGPNPRAILSASGDNKSILRRASRAIVEDSRTNEARIESYARWYQAGACLLLVEAALVIAATIYIR
ncbi:hypothetical protein ABZ924_31700 [Streptomyces sp. NPDC046876]|uniref:hypothetical protein n=1 Tax=Streptomyces sp. NPDC046876 TaxID=3155616 RepID=UPI003400B3F1